MLATEPTLPLLEDPPPGFRLLRHRHWGDVPEAVWQDWRWQSRNSVRSIDDLQRYLPIPDRDVSRLKELESRFKLAIPPYYLDLIDPRDPIDPIRLQSVPSVEELDQPEDAEYEDPLGEDDDKPVPGLTHRYPDRVLVLTTPVCSMYCRFCTRKRVTMDRDGWDAPSHDEKRMVDYVRRHPEIHDVVLSGGDPLMLPPAKLRWFLAAFGAIEHVGVIRIGTRVPVTLPQRLFDPELVSVLGESGKVWIQTHFNHPRELTPEAERATRALIGAGMPLNNHSVLLRGVNDDLDTMRKLVRGLMRIRVRPYYLFHCDPVVGAGHLRTPVGVGIELLEGLRGHVSGLAVPTYVIDGLKGAGKIPVGPNYVLSQSERAIVLRNYEGVIFRYEPEPERSAPLPTLAQTQGVSALLSGTEEALVPARVKRLERRKKSTSQTSKRAKRV